MTWPGGRESPREGDELAHAAERSVVCEAMAGKTLDQSEAARRRARAGREQVMTRHSSDRRVRGVDAPHRAPRAAKKAARTTP